MITETKVKELLSNILIAKVERILPHENADRLKIVHISVGEALKNLPDDIKNEDNTIQVVTAATNFKEGDIVPYLASGNLVPAPFFTDGTEFRLESRPMRGEISHGMILAEDEIGIGKDHSGILVMNESEEFSADEGMVGRNFADVLNDSVFKEIVANENILEDLKATTVEIIGEEDLKALIKSGSKLNHYIGFEISGLIHLGTGLMAGLVIRELQELGVTCKIFLADWHTWMNNKFGGDKAFIRKVAKEYFGPGMAKSIDIAGGDSSKVEFILGSDLYDKNNNYWETVIDVSKNLTLSRVIKSTTILGREESHSLEFAMLIYPSMQVADIYEMGNHIAHAGTDQRKAHVIAREVAEKIEKNPLKTADGKPLKPISIHHPLVSGLQKPKQWPLPKDVDTKQLLTTLKMSKSVKGSAIYINDSEKEIKETINQAFCPEKEIGYNPVLNWIRLIIFPIIGEFKLEREEKFGGNLEFKTYEELENAYAKGEVYPLDLKLNVARYLIKILEPAREFFASEEKQSLIKEIKERRSR